METLRDPNPKRTLVAVGRCYEEFGYRIVEIDWAGPDRPGAIHVTIRRPARYEIDVELVDRGAR